jgi:hypothetical protein
LISFEAIGAVVLVVWSQERSICLPIKSFMIGALPL